MQLDDNEEDFTNMNVTIKLYTETLQMSRMEHGTVLLETGSEGSSPNAFRKQVRRQLAVCFLLGLLFHHEHGSNKFLRNVCKFCQKASRPQTFHDHRRDSLKSKMIRNVSFLQGG
jgi:hypothetical protein